MTRTLRPRARSTTGLCGRALARVLSAALLAVILAAVPGSAIADGPQPPETFAKPAALARAASIMLRRPEPPAAEPDPLEIVLDARRHRAIAAGIIVDPRGIAVTSALAVLNVPDFEVVDADGAAVGATVLAVDRVTDVAVLGLGRRGDIFPHVPFGDSRRLSLGEWVIAVGAPYGFPGTVTAGIVTALPTPGGTDPLHGLLRTDALRGRGNLAAAVVNLDGELVGLGTVLGEDAGYARPASLVRAVYLELLEKGRVARPWLGVTTQTLRDELARTLRVPRAGVLISDVVPGGPAAGAGVRGGDVVVAVEGTAVDTRAQFDQAVSALPVGRPARLTVRRDGRTLTVRVPVSEEPLPWAQRPAFVRARRLFGMAVEPLTPTVGAVVVDVDAPGPAARVGIEAGDIIREVNRVRVDTIGDFLSAVATLRPGTPVLLLIQRDEVALYVVVTGDE